MYNLKLLLKKNGQTIKTNYQVRANSLFQAINLTREAFAGYSVTIIYQG